MKHELMGRKFELVPDQSIDFFGHMLFRIRALRDFGDVRAGDIGGYIERETNLSHDGNAWVWDNARVYGRARVYGDAQIYDHALVCDNARVYGNARVCDNARVFDKARVYGNARVWDNAHVYGNARVCGNAQVYDHARVCGNARVYSGASLCWMSNVGSKNGTLTAFTAQAGITVTRGCFLGTLEEFEAAVRKTHGDSRIAREYALLIEFIRLRLGAAQARVNARQGGWQ